MSASAATFDEQPDTPSPAASEGRRLRRMALLLATVSTVYLLGGYFAHERPPLATALADFAFTWAGQLAVALAMLHLIARGHRRVPAGGTARWAGLVLLVLACALAGALCQGLAYFLRTIGSDFKMGNPAHLLTWNLSLATLLVVAHTFGERSRNALGALHDIEMRRVALERELASARLGLLQAQVEPHFLFNALANVRRLLRTDAAAGRMLLADLLRYLQEALPAMRDERSTLGREAELVRAYLAVHQVRMGARLRTEIDVPADLADREVPPMVLLTLVENALKHGLQPMVDGGTVRIEVRAQEGRLRLTVADTGRGMGNSSGHGTGLANVRARLKSMYGTAASLSLAVNEPRGVVATVVLPEVAA